MAANERRLLVVNADDLGLHPDINRGIREAHQHGILTSASLVACGAAFEDALRVLRDCPGLGVGVHLTLIEESPLCKPEQVGSLLDSSGRFHGSYRRFSERLFLRRIRAEEIRQELDAQIRRVLDAGVRPSHIDSHQHVHMLPGVWQAATELAERHQIPYVRVPRFQDVWTWAKDPLEYVSRIGLNTLSRVRRRRLGTLRAADHTAGLHLSGRLKTADLVKMLQSLAPGLTELAVHPGVNTPDLERQYRWGFDWSGEMSALTAEEVRETLQRSETCLTNYGVYAQIQDQE